MGRRTAADPKRVDDVVRPLRKPTADRILSTSREEMVERRVAFLTDYQSRRYARRYQALADKVLAAEAAKTPGKHGLAEAVSRYYFKLLAIKDEYEVARLYTDGAFARQVAAAFEGNLRYEFHLAPPIMGRKDAQGRPIKTTFGPWMMSAFGVLAKLRFLRGTPLDIFGHSEERQKERKLIADYEGLVDELLQGLTSENHSLAVALASLPEKIRGYGHVKETHLKKAKAEEAELLTQFRASPKPVRIAAE